MGHDNSDFKNWPTAELSVMGSYEDIWSCPFFGFAYASFIKISFHRFVVIFPTFGFEYPSTNRFYLPNLPHCGYRRSNLTVIGVKTEHHYVNVLKSWISHQLMRLYLHGRNIFMQTSDKLRNVDSESSFLSSFYNEMFILVPIRF